MCTNSESKSSSDARDELYISEAFLVILNVLSTIWIHIIIIIIIIIIMNIIIIIIVIIITIIIVIIIIINIIFTIIIIITITGNCLVSGQGHYKTFDNHYYDFAGTCSYILLKDCWNPFSIYLVSIENTACGMEGASCVKAVVIQDGALEIRLRRGSQVLINGEEVTQFPKMVGKFYVNQPTRTQTAVS